MSDAYYDFLDKEAPAGCEPVRTLWEWSLNCEHPTPALVFSDLVGISEDFFGEAMCGDMGTASRNLGYLELSYLAEAMSAYSERPGQVRAYVLDLLEAEGDL